MNRKLRVAIVEHFGTQENFAKKVGIAESMLSYVVHGKFNLTEREMKRWSRLLKTDKGELFPEKTGRRTS